LKIFRPIVSKTEDYTVREYLEKFRPTMMTDPGFQADDEDGRWEDKNQSSFLTSLINNMAPSKFILADVEKSFEYHTEKRNQLDIDYYVEWINKNAKWLNVDSHNRSNTLTAFIPKDITGKIDGTAKLEHGKYIIEGVGDFTIGNGNDTWLTMHEDLKNYILDCCYITIQTYTNCTRNELSELAIRVNKGMAWNEAETRNTYTSETAKTYRNLATKYKSFLKTDGCKYFHASQLKRRGIDDFFASLGCVAFYGVDKSITHTLKFQMYQIKSDHEKQVKSIGSTISKFMTLLDKEMFAIPDKLSVFDLWYLFYQMDKKNMFIPDDKKKTMIKDYIKVVGDLLTEKDSDGNIIQHKIEAKGTVVFKPFELLVGGLQKANNKKRIELIKDKFNIETYAKKRGPRSQTARGKFKSAHTQNYVTPEGKPINKSRLHTSDYHNGHDPEDLAWIDGGNKFKVQEARDNLKLGRQKVDRQTTRG